MAMGTIRTSDAQSVFGSARAWHRGSRDGTLCVDDVDAPAAMSVLRRRRSDRRSTPAPPSYDEELRAVLLLAQEGLYWQGDLEELLESIRDGGELGDLTRAGGPIISRYEAMRVSLRAVREPRLRPYARALDEVFANHALLLHSALDLLAGASRSERLRDEQRKLGGVGAQGVRLERLTRELEALAQQQTPSAMLGLPAEP
jgi:hypothetical protein